MMQTTFTKDLRVPLTRDDRDNAGTRLAKIAVEVEEKQAKIKEVSAELKLNVKNLQAEAKKIGRSLLDGFVEKDVRCEEHLNLEDKRVETVRMDTNVVVESRPATEEELQGNLFTVPRVPRDDKDSAGPATSEVLAAEAELRGDDVEAERIRAEAKAKQEAPLSPEEQAADEAAAAKAAEQGTGTDGASVTQMPKRARKSKKERTE